MADDERLGEVESQLDRLENRLETIEKLLSSQTADMDQVRNLFAFFRGSLRFYDEVSHMLSYISSFQKVNKHGWISKDPLAKAILTDLARRGPRNISQLTRDMRELRGTASRRVVSERVDRLIDCGIIEEERSGSSRMLRLGEDGSGKS